ncbi:type 4 pilus major pilin [Escherichia coli]|nr:type 4 pilus major pilin [Escherichia coli]KDT77039.1 major structural subunit of bundle-forming pilus [Escherichia coli 3-373-03_S1_C2]KDU34406.1 major structural subunit of bundle-forming pilus [Escherichia coli 3-373-03_S1_C3]KDU42553.1 major structural subunit of bundle-forming pilus [Escherichia coli 3-373-03_S1_C1]HBE7874507.1 pilus assembly protein [Escherichia coli]
MVNIMQQKKMVLRKNKMEKGLSLIEASMVLALSAIVVSGVMFYYQSASDSNKTQNTVSQVMSVMSAINGLYVGQASYSGLSDTVLYNSSAVPANYKGSTGEINNPFGGKLHVAQNTDNSGGYALLLDGVPQSSCVNIASMNLGTSLQGVGVGPNIMNNKSTSVKLAAVKAGSSVNANIIYSGTLSPANAAKLCTGVTNSITFLMK